MCFIDVLFVAFVLTTSSERATVGLDFNFTCNSTDNTIVSIIRNSTYECIISNDDTCTLHFHNPDYNYTCYNNSIILTIPGTYDIDILHKSFWKCGSLFGGSMSNTVLLNVFVPITKINLTAIPYDKNPVEVLSGSSQHFSCTTDAGRPPSKIQWYMSSANITNAATAQPDTCHPGCNEKVISSSVLQYIGDINDNGKTIYCTAENVEEQSIRSLDRRIDILYPPVIIDIPDYNITEGSILHINPTIDANPQPISVWWTRENDTSFKYSGMNLTINNIQRESSDYYKCNAMNTITTPNHPTQNKTTEELFKVNVLYPPSVYMEPSYSPFIVQEDQQNIRLSCVVATANPKDAIMYQWTYPAGTVRDGDLTITTVSKSHYGLYSCNASNSVGTSTTAKKQVDVHYGPVISRLQDHNIEAGKTLTVTPSVDANPPSTTIWWTRQNNISFIYYGLNLTIINIHQRDSDNYTCYVMNTVTPSGLSAQNKTSKTVLNINVQKILNEETVNGAAIGVGTGFAIITLTLGVTSLFVFLYRKRRMTKRRENSNSKVYESGLDKPRQMSETDKHLYNELQDQKSDAKQQHKSSERISNTYEEFGEVKSNTNDNIYENMKISTNDIQIHHKDTNLYVNMELKPSSKS
ncbi:unnamed protein product [Mytilus coruscus]|uniref:Ig-like domain-containing protein n=1 Tax=Mytilus coruscus TaxID=42192 RepID=A0A6J8EGB3_MYTCO|nr:unnamed protein product [Mytilus coruscus]